MKFSLATLAVMAATGLAAPSAEPGCTWVDQSCSKVKRDAGEALSNALHTTRDIEVPRLNARSIGDTTQINAARQAKRSIVELANMVALSARGSPEDYFKSLDLAEHFPDADGKVKREAAPEPQKYCKKFQWCMCVGQSCWKAKRAAEAVLATIDARDAGSEDSHFDARSFNPENFAAKRDIMAIKAVARSIVDANQE